MLRGWMGAVLVTFLAAMLLATGLLGLRILGCADFTLPNVPIPWINIGWNLGQVSRTQEITKSFDGDRVSVSGHNGTITVETWDQDTVDVVAEYTAGSGYSGDPVEVEEMGDTLSIKVERTTELHGVRYMIRVPKAVELVLLTSNGSIKVTGGSGSVNATTSNGRVEIKDRDGGHVVVQTSNGRVNIDMLALDGMVDVRTSNGAINLTIPSGAGFELRSSTSNGSVDAQLPGSWTNLSTGRSSLGGYYDGGGPPVSLRTSNGNTVMRSE